MYTSYQMFRNLDEEALDFLIEKINEDEDEIAQMGSIVHPTGEISWWVVVETYLDPDDPDDGDPVEPPVDPDPTPSGGLTLVIPSHWTTEAVAVG